MTVTAAAMKTVRRMIVGYGSSAISLKLSNVHVWMTFPVKESLV